MTGVYQPYDSEGSKLCILLIMCNFYVIVLQILWRTHDQSEKVQSDVNRISNTSDIEGIYQYDGEKKNAGMEYFKDNYEVALKKVQTPIRPTAIFPDNEEKLCRESPEKVRVEKPRSSNPRTSRKVDVRLEYVDEPISETKLENPAIFIQDDHARLQANVQPDFVNQAFDEQETIVNISAEDMQVTVTVSPPTDNQPQEMEPKFI